MPDRGPPESDTVGQKPPPPSLRQNDICCYVESSNSYHLPGLLVFFCSQIIVIRLQLVLVSVNMGVRLYLGMYQVSRNNSASNLIQSQFH